MNNDGTVDFVARDDDRDGLVDRAAYDDDHDGDPDTVWVDTDGDGYLDVSRPAPAESGPSAGTGGAPTDGGDSGDDVTPTPGEGNAGLPDSVPIGFANN